MRISDWSSDVCSSDLWRAGIVHRLDRNTSGLLVVAKSELVHRHLKNALQRRDIQREYLTLVEGRPESRSGPIDAPIGPYRKARTKPSTVPDHSQERRVGQEGSSAVIFMVQPQP